MFTAFHYRNESVLEHNIDEVLAGVTSAVLYRLLNMFLSIFLINILAEFNTLLLHTSCKFCSHLIRLNQEAI